MAGGCARPPIQWGSGDYFRLGESCGIWSCLLISV